jgi:hypothetical protein
MFSFLARGFASLSLALKQPLTAFCELETAHDDALITKTGHISPGSASTVCSAWPSARTSSR